MEMVTLRGSVQLTKTNIHYWEVTLPVAEAASCCLDTGVVGIEAAQVLANAIMATLPRMSGSVVRAAIRESGRLGAGCPHCGRD